MKYFVSFVLLVLVSLPPWAMASHTPVKSHTFDFSPLDVIMEKGVKDGVFPGATAFVSLDGKIIYHKAIGRYTYDQASPKVSIDTLFDLASLTKVIATTTAVMLLCDAKKISIDDLVSTYIPTFAHDDKKEIRIKHLLSHTSGLRDTPDIRYFAGCDIAEITRKIDNFAPVSRAGKECVYAGVNMMILERIIEMVAHEKFDSFVHNHITKPLGMHDTLFRPTDRIKRCMPTTDAGTGEFLQGIVHDNQARVLGGAAGHAGLFGTARDVAKYMSMIMANGVDEHGNKFISPEIAKSWRTRVDNCERGYGWDIGRFLSQNAFGHFGWTGTSMWADPDRKLICVLLTNRVYPTQDNFKIKDFRRDFHTGVLNIIKSEL